MIPAMTQQSAPIPAGELRAAIRDLDARSARPSGLVMSPETWATLAAQEHGDTASATYAGVPVWLRIDCADVELIARRAPGPGAQDEVLWI